MLWIGVLTLFALPCQARADAGTPLMWASAIHLLFGNALVGLVEGWLLAFCCRLSKWRTIGVMIAANYVSAWSGLALLHVWVLPRLPIDLNNGWYWFWALVAAAYVVTLIMEWPFVALCFWKQERWFRRSLWSNLFLQTFSYAVLFGWYAMASQTSLYTKMHVVPVSKMKLPATERIYFIGEGENAVYSCDLYGRDRRWVRTVNVPGKLDRLVALPSREHSRTWDLVAVERQKESRYSEYFEIIGGIQTNYAQEWQASVTSPEAYPETTFSFGNAAHLKGAPQSEWEFQSGFWSAEGLKAIHAKTKERVCLSFETPFGAWAIRNVTQLPSDQAVFQLGENQICVFDPETKQVALITHGRGPVVWFGR